jgi:HK97 family phage prohead protease
MKDFTIFAPLLKTSQSEGKKRLHGTASSTVKDRHGDVITLAALQKMEASAKRMTIFLNHNYQVPEDVAGTVSQASIRNHPSDPDIHDLVFDIEMNESNPRAMAAFDAIQGGTQLGLSIGAQIPEGGATRDAEGVFTIEDIELLETSLVGVPASPRSWVEYAVKSLRSQMIKEATVIKPTPVDAEETDDAEEPTGEVEEITTVELAAEGPAEDAEASDEDQSTTDEDPDVEPDAEPPGEVRFDQSATPQDAPEPVSNPETGDDLLQSEDDEITSKALLASADTLTKAHDVIARLDRELDETKAALTEVTGERDQVVAKTAETLQATSTLLERLAAASKGRKTSPMVIEAVAEFEGLKDVYSDVVMTLLKEHNHHVRS